MTSINKPADNSNSAATADVSPTRDRWTIKRLLNWTTDYFVESGFDQARLDAEVLLSEALECQRIDLYTRFDEEPSENQRSAFRDWVARHARGEPVAYLVGHREFFSIRFLVNASVLIPRPETEHLVNEALDVIRSFDKKDQPIRVVDVGTGSGNVAIAICKHSENIQMVACDISEEALQVARQNAVLNQVDPAITFVLSDLLGDIAEPSKFDLIVSNPPYIGLAEKADLDKSVVDFEPHQALFANGAEGTETISKLVEQSVLRLQPDGFLMFEISPMIAGACQGIIESTPGLNYVKTVSDLAGLKRIIVAQRVGM